MDAYDMIYGIIRLLIKNKPLRIEEINYQGNIINKMI